MGQDVFSLREENSLVNEKIQDGDYVLIYLDARRTYMIKDAGRTNISHTQRLHKT